MISGGTQPELNLRGILRTNLAGETTHVTELDDLGRMVVVQAPNAIEWCVGPEWCNSPSLYEYWRSYQTIRDYFELRCPICNLGSTEEGQPGDCWGKSRMQLEDEVLLVWDEDNVEDTCPKCGITRSELIEDEIFAGYNQMHLVVGMRAGKSMTAALIGTYVEHVFLSIGHRWDGGIHGYLGITPAEKFEMTFLASNQVQSEDTIWSKYTSFRAQSPWFRRYVPWVKQLEERQPRFGMKPWKYSEGTKKIANEHPRVRLDINALNSNSSGQAGRTRVHGFVDELARMTQTDGRLGAEEIYRTIEASLRTIRSRVKAYGGLPWFGSMVSVTSPIARDDKAMRLFRKADEIDDMYARKYATWDFNPKEPRENFESDFKKDPVGAARDFGANPPGAEHPLVHDELRWLDLAIEWTAKAKAHFELYERRDPQGQEYIAIRLKHADRMFDRRMPRQVVFDAGKNFDAFTGCAAHGEYIYDEAEKQDRLITVYDWVFRILPLPGTEVWFDSVEQLMKDLKKQQFTAFVAFDRWNSVQLIQNIRDLGIPAEQEPLSDKDFIDWKVDCFSGKCRMLPPAPGDYKTEKGSKEPIKPIEWIIEPPYLQASSCGIYELLGLQKDPDTGKVANPNKGDQRGFNSDDVARVIVHAHRNVQRAGFSEKYDDTSRRAARRKAEHGGSQWGRRGTIVRPSTGAPRNWGKGRGW